MIVSTYHSVIIHSIHSAILYYLQGMKARSLAPVCVFFFCLFAETLVAQNREADRANDLYKSSRYSEAAALFEEALTKLADEGKGDKAAFALKTKLAYCYRMNNKMDKAESLYAEVVMDERARSDSYFFYGEALMSNGKYEEAKKWFREYKILEPEDERADLMIQSCLMVPFIEPYFPGVEIQPFEFNSDADDNAPIVWEDGILFSSDRKQGLKIMKEKSGWTGRDFLDLYYSKSDADGNYLPPKAFSSRLSASNKNTGNATISADGSEIFFTRNDNELNKQSTYNLQIYRAESAGTGRWKKVQKLPFCSSAFNFMHPALSPNGQLLFFTSNKSGSLGGTDLWVVKREKNGWGRPENLGPKVNTTANEGFPFFDHLGRLFFCSKGHPGFGGFDIFVTEQDAEGQWITPRNLGQPINSPLDDISIFIDKEGKTGLFTSSRDGGDDDIYHFVVLDESHKQQSEVTSTLEKEEAPVVFIRPAKPEPPPVLIPEKKEESSPVSTEEPIPVIIGKPRQAVKVVEPETIAQLTVDGANSVKEILPIFTDTSSIIPVNNNPTIIRPAFHKFELKLIEGTLEPGERYKLDAVSFDPNVWQLTPLVKIQLDKLVALLKMYPLSEMEIGVHTESLGNHDENLIISELRARMVVDYLKQEGLLKMKLNAMGYGESVPLNHCTDGIPCTIEEHLYNNRLEIRIIRL